jgi:formylmethanofuran dehydrogenase subunit B
MNAKEYRSEITNATCPACGLLCDDIIVSPTSPLSINQTCRKAVEFFSQVSNVTLPQIAGKNTDLISAITEVARLLKSSKQPLFAGLGTEVQGMRAIIQLAEKTNATLDHMHSEATVRNTRTLQNTGWQTTTLTEIKNHADLVIAIGTDIISSYPRFLEKVIENKNSLFREKPTQIEYLLTQRDNNQSLANDLPNLINALNALALNKPLHTEAIAGISISTLTALITKIKAAKYCVIIWSASQFNFPHAELSIQSIARLITTLNLKTRVAGFPLDSGDGDTSVNNVSTWLTGFATRNRVIHHQAHYDNHQFSTKNLLETSDVLVWFSSFHPHSPPKTNSPVVVIGHPNTTFNQTPAVFIPVGIPGLDHKGTMFRMDSAVALPLKKIRASSLQSYVLPNLSEVCHQILEAVTC